MMHVVSLAAGALVGCVPTKSFFPDTIIEYKETQKDEAVEPYLGIGEYIVKKEGNKLALTIDGSTIASADCTNVEDMSSFKDILHSLHDRSVFVQISKMRIITFSERSDEGKMRRQNMDPALETFLALDRLAPSK